MCSTCMTSIRNGLHLHDRHGRTPHIEFIAICELSRLKTKGLEADGKSLNGTFNEIGPKLDPESRIITIRHDLCT